MKLFFNLFLLGSLIGSSLLASEGSNPENKPESNISYGTKKVLRKVGRKTRDATCEWTEYTAKCEKEKIEHIKANGVDSLDSKKRKMNQASKEYDDEKTNVKVK